MPVSANFSIPGHFKQFIARTSDDQTSATSLLVLDSFDSDVERINSVPHRLVRQGCNAKLLQRIVGIGDELPKKYIPASYCK